MARRVKKDRDEKSLSFCNVGVTNGRPRAFNERPYEFVLHAVKTCFTEGTPSGRFFCLRGGGEATYAYGAIVPSPIKKEAPRRDEGRKSYRLITPKILLCKPIITRSDPPVKPIFALYKSSVLRYNEKEENQDQRRDAP